MKADLIIENARIRTVDDIRPVAARMAIWQGMVLGFDEEIDDLKAKEVVDLNQRTVLPGLIDGHTHLGTTGLLSIALDVSAERSREAVLSRISRAAAGLRPHEWLDVVGYDQRAIGDAHLTAKELDLAGEGRPVWVKHISNHASVVSTAVVKAAKEHTIAGYSTEQQGLLIDEEQTLVTEQRLPYPLSTVEDAISSAGHQCLSEGITACVDAGVGSGIESLSHLELAAYARLRRRGALPVRAQLMPHYGVLHAIPGHVDDHVTIGLDLGLQQGFGDDWLSLGAVKIWIDGGMMARSAALTAPYEGTNNLGILNEDPSTVVDQIGRAHSSGWQIAAHAIGDRAIDLAIEAFESAQSDIPRSDLKHRIEHGGYIRDDQVSRLSRLNVSISTQPCFLWGSGDDFTRVVGAERAQRLYRGRSLINAGIRLIGSTDRPLPGTPLQAMQVLVERRSSTGLPMGPEEAISIDEAIQAFTINPAQAAGWGDRLGSLSPGKRADFTVLGNDPRAVEASQIGQIPVLGTYIDGLKRWEATG
ncbi:amidohydrolase [Spelaeicoccus albus]|uniref:Amidohydrolase 3 domain-containing protein n=1 Tax=Spelaeicoccus albus TaxID=1280376 RepID=A0A7Z0IIT1_9MICO|nr:amidohydrolase [Spelaeicoccus albus]NYI68779.1 hypothetical protein [Spelaeicoccus albus]